MKIKFRITTQLQIDKPLFISNIKQKIKIKIEGVRDPIEQVGNIQSTQIK